MTHTEALQVALETLESNRRTHHYCEDTWYSCPKHEDGCANDSEGNECNCGADKVNAGIDQAITAIKAALEAKDEPEYYGLTKDRLWMSISKEHYDRLKPEFRMACYTAPPQRTWTGLTDEDISEIVRGTHNTGSFVRAIEAKLKEKNT